MNEKTRQAVIKHGNSLLFAFPNSTEKDPIALCKKLRRIENSVSRVTAGYCNGVCATDETDAACDKALKRATELLGGYRGFCGLFVNRDPRGYALKLSEKWTYYHNQKLRDQGKYSLQIHQDWGHYGILAPEIKE